MQMGKYLLIPVLNGIIDRAETKNIVTKLLNRGEIGGEGRISDY